MSRAKKTQRPTPVNDDEQWVQWRQDIARIYMDNVAAFRDRLVFRELNRIVKDNERLQSEGGYFLLWVAGCYAHRQALAVRREVDDSNDAINLVQLLNQMIRRPEVMSRARYKANFPPESAATPGHLSEEMKNATFNGLAADRARFLEPGYISSLEHVSQKVVSEDRKRMLNACEPVATYVSKLIAHRTPIDNLKLTLSQVDTALDAIEIVFQKYMTLLTGRSVLQLEPAVQFDRQDIFTYPWVEQRDAQLDADAE